MKKLWTSFEVVAHLVLKAGGRIDIEWPFNCAYWHGKKGCAPLLNFIILTERTVEAARSESLITRGPRWPSHGTLRLRPFRL